MLRIPMNRINKKAMQVAVSNSRFPRKPVRMGGGGAVFS